MMMAVGGATSTELSPQQHDLFSLYVETRLSIEKLSLYWRSTAPDLAANF
jgi:hypothetical protein